MPEADDVTVGTCALITDAASDEVCNDPGIEEVLVRNKFGLFAVWLCRKHKAEHTEFYAIQRTRPRVSPSSRRRITQGSRV